MKNNIDSFLQIQQSLSLEALKQHNNVLVKNAINQNDEIRKLQQQIDNSSKLNRQILENQRKEIERRINQQQYKNTVFKLKEIVDKLDTFDNDSLKTFIIRNYFNQIESLVQEAQNNLEDISDKEYCSQILGRISLISSDTNQDQYSSSIFFSFENSINDYKKLQNTHPAITSSGNYQEIKPKYRKKRLSWIGAIIIVLVISLLRGIFNAENYSDSEGIYATIFFVAVIIFVILFLTYREIKWVKKYPEYISPIMETKNKNEMAIKEYENSLKNHTIHNIYHKVDNEYPQLNEFIRELELLENNKASK